MIINKFFHSTNRRMLSAGIAVLALASSGCSHAPATVQTQSVPASSQQEAQIRQQYVVQLQNQLASLQKNQALSPQQKLRATNEITGMIHQMSGGQ